MKKKLLGLVLISAAAFALAGCAGRARAVTITEEVANANPWIEYDTIEEIEELAGFEMDYPEEFAGHTAEDIIFYYCDPLKEIQISYDDTGADYIRKADDDGDISGDYQEYPFVAEVEIDGKTVTFKGASKDVISLANWREDKFAFCVRAEAGISSEEMKAAILAVN